MLPLSDILKKWGLRGLVIAMLLIVVGYVGWWHYTRDQDRQYLPGSVVITVNGARDLLSLRLDGRPDIAPPSERFFRVEGVQPGPHQIELFSKDAALFTTVREVVGGRSNRFHFDLAIASTLPSFDSLPIRSEPTKGWVYLGASNAKAGDRLNFVEPAFVRTSPPITANMNTIAGEAFATYQAGQTARVTDLVTDEDGAVWAQVRAQVSPEVQQPKQ